MAIIDKLYLKDEYGEDVAYDIGANGDNVTFGENISVNSKLSSLSSTVGEQGTNLSNHTNSSVPSESGSHGIRYYNSALQVKNGSDWSDVTTGGNIAAIPICIEKYTYNGSSQTPTFIGYDSNKMTASGLTSKTNAGTYEVTFTLKNGYQQEDGTTSSKAMTQTIEKAEGYVNFTSVRYGSAKFENGIYYVTNGTEINYPSEEDNLQFSASGEIIQDNCDDGLAAVIQQSGSNKYVSVRSLTLGKHDVILTVKESSNYKEKNFPMIYYSQTAVNKNYGSQSTSPDEIIGLMIVDHYKNDLNLKDYQAVGDIRIADENNYIMQIHSGTFQNTGSCTDGNEYVKQSTCAQVILGFDHDTLQSAKDGKTKAAITVQMVGKLSKTESGDQYYFRMLPADYSYTVNNFQGTKVYEQMKYVRLNTAMGDEQTRYFAPKSVVKTINQVDTTPSTTTYNTEFFLLSVDEYRSSSSFGDGTQYDYYKIQSNTGKNPGQNPIYQTPSGESAKHQTRTVASGNKSYIMLYNSYSSVTDSSTYGVSLACCI